MDVDMSRFRDSVGSLIKKAPPLSIPVEMKSFNFPALPDSGIFRITADMGKLERPARGKIHKFHMAKLIGPRKNPVTFQ